MAKVTCVLETRKSKKGYQLRIRTYSKGEIKYYPLGLFLPRKGDFSKKTNTVLSSFEDHERFNKIIKKELDKYTNLIESDPNTNVKVSEKTDVFKELSRYNQLLLLDGQISVKHNNSVLKNHLKKFLSRENELSVYEIDRDFMNKFYLYLRKSMRRPSIRINISYLKQCIDRIIENNELDIKNHAALFKIPQGNEPQKEVYLNKNILDSFIRNPQKKKQEILTKYSSLFMFYAQGQRFSDNFFQKWNNIKKYPIEEEVFLESLESGEAYTGGYKYVLSFVTDKVDQVNKMVLCDSALKCLRFFLSKENQISLLNGKGDFIIEDEELSIIAKHKADKTNKRVLTFDSEEAFEFLKDFLDIQSLQTPNEFTFHNKDLTGYSLEKIKSCQTAERQKRNEWLRKICKNIETLELTCHDFRRLFAIIFYTKTSDIYALSSMLFHSSIKITVEYLKKLNVFDLNENKALEFYNDL
ncbi:hypothetical protein DF185_07845 [Marinifilum breve]|uniref:Tyr recombinase domain-containing protein n=1 Tax=Marinifilum breve TaxID=2184082 RepID=A0A2V4A0L5_9BACT|nr:tyrosine-type recombinase/integrase [Marinifilum breve]PXY01387.1 hypothetical protein DF185_07845 [Marinifilum breve]